MLGAPLLTNHALCNQMLVTNQLIEHHNDPLNLKFASSFLLYMTTLSAKSFTKTALKFREDLVKIFIHLAIHLQILEITGKIFTGL